MSTPTTSAMDSSGDTTLMMNMYRSYINTLLAEESKDNTKAMALQEIWDNFDAILSSPHYPSFLDLCLNAFIKLLSEGTPQFHSESHIHKTRKLMLELINRFPCNEYFKPHLEPLLKLCVDLLEKENEENVLIVIRIFFELHKHFRPPQHAEVPRFIKYTKTLYKGLGEYVNKMFDVTKNPVRQFNSISEVNVEAINALVNDIYTITTINVPYIGPDKKPANKQIKIFPRGYQSLKTMQELPLIIVLVYQLYKENVKKDLEEFIPIILKTVNLKPPIDFKTAPDFYKEIYVDFMGAQIKTLSFLAYLVRFYQDILNKHSQLLVDGVLNLLVLCPSEVTHLRKELLIAARHILQTEFRTNFVPHMSQLFEEDFQLGSGWTTHESLRPLVYSTLADLVHHVRQLLPMSDLIKAVHLFSKNIHDETLPTTIHTMSCKLLLNLVDFIRTKNQAEIEQGRQGDNIGQELLERMLETMVLKFKTIAKLQLPVLTAKAKAQLALPAAEMTPTTEDIKPVINPLTNLIESPAKAGMEKQKPRLGISSSPAANYNVNDCRSIVKILICGVKTVTMGLAASSVKASGTEGGPTTPPFGQFQPKDTKVYIRLVKWALKALDVYTLNQPSGLLPNNMQRTPMQQASRTKEEKEVLEHFAGVFSLMTPQTFREIFASTIDYMVDRMAHNYTLQVISNSFLVTRDTSPVFATVLVEYLLEHMEEMGNGNVERSNLCLKLFKLVFGSVSFYPAENEHMLRPHLHQIVNRSMELAMTAKEPYNYFLLLRALFRSIGGGSHDLLYQEFLPLLRNLLQGLNSLQSGLHKQQMKDLFVELCLTVPVRLSSLLPYLPMLMDPLVSALNGSYTLISQGLRTLELCVDNLQPDFLYDHIQPVRADLMQALWRSLRSPNEQVAHVAYRVLGKFGGGNRKMMIEPQKLDYNIRRSNGPAVVVHFPEHQKTINLSVEKAIEVAITVLKSSNVDMFYRKQGWKVVKGYIISSMSLSDNRSTIQKLFSHHSFTNTESSQGTMYKYADPTIRNTHQTALTGIFIVYLIKELRKDSLLYTVLVVRHYTLVAITQQAGPFPLYGKSALLEGTMDPLVLIDAIAVILGHEDKELCKPGHIALKCIVETATCITGSIEKACNLPLMEYLAERMCNLCYERAWYAKLGGCYAIKFFYNTMAIKWVYSHMFVFVKALLFVMMDLTGEVSSGAIDEAKRNLKELIVLCATPMKEPVDLDTLTVQSKALSEVTNELTRNITLPNDLLREQSMYLLQVFAETQGKSVVQVMEPHKDVLVDIIPPKKLLIRNHSANAQIGLMEGNTFCQSLTPRLFTTDMSIHEHSSFFQEITNICESSDQALMKLPCYKPISSLVPLRKAAMRALASWHYVPNCSQKIFNTLFAALERPNPELQEAAFQAMKTFVNGSPIDLKSVYEVMKPLLLTLGDYRNLNLVTARKLSYIVQPFPSSFSEKLCEQLLVNLKNLFENLVAQKDNPPKNNETEKIIVVIIGIFKESPAAKSQFIDPLISLILENEHVLSIGPYSPYREPLVKYLLRYPTETLQSIMSEVHMKNPLWRNFFVYLIKHQEGKCFRDALQTQFVDRLIVYTYAAHNPNFTNWTTAEKLEMQYMGIRLVSILIKLDTKWLASQNQLISVMQKLWCDEYLQRHRKVENISYVHWKEPKLLVKILLHYFSHHRNIIDLLFFILRAVTTRLLPDFTFLREFLETTVAQTYPIEWKRKAFLRFIELFKLPQVSQELKAKILQLVLIPCFTVCFEKGEGDKLITGTGTPQDEENKNLNLVNEFISNILEPLVETPPTLVISDSVRILLYQMCCLIIEQASHYVYLMSEGKVVTNKTKPFILFAWTYSLQGKNNYTDPATRYHGHLLLAHMTAQLNVGQRIVINVFLGLLKAHASEVRPIVRQALEILTPAFPKRVDDGQRMLLLYTKKVLVEEGHSNPQLSHVLTLIVKHYKVYYPVRHGLIQHMVANMQRMGMSTSIDHKKLSVELADVIVKWELLRIKNERDAPLEEPAFKKMAMTGLTSTGESSSQPTQEDLSITAAKPIEKTHVDAVINFLCRFACPTIELPPNSIHNQMLQSQGEGLSKRCVALVKVCLNSELWPRQNIDLRISWLDKLLCTVDDASVNLNNIATAFELLLFFISVFDNAQVLLVMKPLQKGLFTCIKSNNPTVINHTQNFLSKLMEKFPIEYTPEVSYGREEIDILYAYLSQMIIDSLSTYEKTLTASSSILYGSIMFLKAACCGYVKYIDRFLDLLIRILNRLSQEHTKASGDVPSPHEVELLSTGLDLVKNRLGGLSKESRSLLIERTLVELVEKSTDTILMKAILDMTDKWVRGIDTDAENAPTLNEKCLLLVKLMHIINKFPDLNTQYLELTLFIYTDQRLKNSLLVSKLKPAFLSGLLSTNPELRCKFFQLLNDSIRKLLYDRLMYIFNAQNWEPMGCYSWLRQCIELILVSAVPSSKIKLAEESGILPPGSSSVSVQSTHTATDIEPETLVDKFEAIDANEKADVSDFLNLETDSLRTDTLIQRQINFLHKAQQQSTGDFLKCICHLCHLDSGLAEHVWLDMFPQLWSILNQYQQQTLASTILPFTVSGIHVNQKPDHPCPMSTVYEAFILCSPSLPIHPVLMTHFGKTHALWHRVTISFESLASDMFGKMRSLGSCQQLTPDQQELISQLSDMYSALKEEDLWVGLWQKKARYPETLEALSYEQQGLFEQALKTYEKAIIKGREEYYVGSTTPSNHNPEVLLWEQQLIRCAKELNQWEMLRDYGKDTSPVNPFLILDTAWKVPPNEWSLMKTMLNQVERDCPKELQWKVSLYHGYLAVCNPGGEQSLPSVTCVEHVEMASTHCIKLWRSYPRIVSHIHIPLLQASQQIIELQEASQIPNSLNDMNATVKTWRTRLPVISDNLSHWSDVFMWRQHHYQFITQHFDALKESGNTGNRSILGVHSSAQAIIQFGKIARKHNLTSVCLESLFKLYRIPSVPIVDCFEKIRQQVKCYVQMATSDGKDQLQEGLEVIEHTNLTYLTKEMTAEFYALKGMLLAQIGRSNEANKAFCMAVEKHDVLVKAWALWGDYMEAEFTSSSPLNTALGVAAITCFLHACRHQNEPKSRKYLAKVFWLLTFNAPKLSELHDRTTNPSLMDALDMYSVGMPPIQWLSWIPQLLTCLGMSSGLPIKDLLTPVSRVYPQAVYLPIRTMYNTLKIEQRARYKAMEQNGKFLNESAGLAGSLNSSQQPSPGCPETSKPESDPIRDTPAMRRCLSIMQTQRDIDPPVMISLKTIVDQMSWFRESWNEQVLRQVRMALAKCYGIAFDKRHYVREAVITAHMFNFVNKLISTFGIGIENVNSEKATATSAGSESLAKRAQQTIQDPAFQKMKSQFARDFEFKVPGANKLHNLIDKLKKWVKILEAKNKRSPTSYLIEENCRYLSNFNLQTAEIELPGEYLSPKHSHSYVCISKFMPRVEVVQKHHSAARRLYIRGHNGKIYPYLVMNDSGLIDSRRDERVLQMLRMLNHYLSKQKETAKRFLHFTVPRVVPISAEFRLVEDNPASLSLLDIYKSRTEEDHPVDKYYQELARYQSSGTMSDQGLLTIYQDIQNTLVHPGLLNTWAVETFHSSTDYWTFRKMGTLQLALACFSEYVFHLTRLSPDMIYLHQDSGLLNVSYFKFDLNESTGELHADKPVPFRLTPNIVQFLTRIGVDGPLSASIVAVARCLSQPNYQVPAILKAILRDEMIAFQKKIQNLDYDVIQEDPPDVPGDMTISMVTRAVTVISSRLNTLAQIQRPVTSPGSLT
uniref:Transformation/transcription domain-associated protein n=1 Tax=Cacopsylla melanoneura TaxID=428564 RepID=A0A8D8TZY5_9HEMI